MPACSSALSWSPPSRARSSQFKRMDSFRVAISRTVFSRSERLFLASLVIEIPLVRRFGRVADARTYAAAAFRPAPHDIEASRRGAYLINRLPAQQATALAGGGGGKPSRRSSYRPPHRESGEGLPMRFVCQHLRPPAGNVPRKLPALWSRAPTR